MLVALTGWGQEDDRRRSSEAGFDAHIVKPIDFEQIEQLCRQAIERGRAELEAAEQASRLPM